jgi:exosome complex RNA-binding protein Rrp42 (RNase PH superfamily)
VVTAALEAPFADRHSEGSLRFAVDLSPMASPAFDPARPGELAVELGRLVERGLRESRAVDLEALCVQAGRRVWALRVDLAVLDHGGNLADACGLAALAALCAFRRPDATVDPGAGVTVHPPWEREPLPLTIHHLPLPVTFALFDAGDALAADPSLREEAAAEGSFTVTVNPHGELCAVHKAHGVGLSPAQTLRCVRVAAAKAKELAATLRQALDAHEVARVAARVRRRGGAQGGAAEGVPAGGAEGRSVLVLRSDELPAAAGGRPLELPEDIRRMMQHAAAPDSSDEDEDEDEGGSSGSSSEEDEEDASMGEAAADAPAAFAMEHDGGPPQAGGAGPAASAEAEEQQRAKKAKRRKTAAAGEAGDPFASIAELIASAGGKGGAAPGDLSAAVKRKSRA